MQQTMQEGVHPQKSFSVDDTIACRRYALCAFSVVCVCRQAAHLVAASLGVQCTLGKHRQERLNLTIDERWWACASKEAESARACQTGVNVQHRECIGRWNSQRAVWTIGRRRLCSRKLELEKNRNIVAEFVCRFPQDSTLASSSLSWPSRNARVRGWFALDQVILILYLFALILQSISSAVGHSMPCSSTHSCLRT